METEEMTIARQWPGRHIPMATNMHTTINTGNVRNDVFYVVNEVI
jgi:hypothetical protein